MIVGEIKWMFWMSSVRETFWQLLYIPSYQTVHLTHNALSLLETPRTKTLKGDACVVILMQYSYHKFCRQRYIMASKGLNSIPGDWVEIYVCNWHISKQTTWFWAVPCMEQSKETLNTLINRYHDDILNYVDLSGVQNWIKVYFLFKFHSKLW